MKLLIGHSDLVAEWAKRRIPHMRNTNGFGPCEAFGVIGGEDGAELLGAVIYHNYCPWYRSIEWSAAAKTPNWLTRDIINDIVAYAFDKLGCVRITAAIPKKAIRVREFHRRFGFKQEGLVRRGFGNDDATVYGLLRSDWAKSPFNLSRVVDGEEKLTSAARAS